MDDFETMRTAFCRKKVPSLVRRWVQPGCNRRVGRVNGYGVFGDVDCHDGGRVPISGQLLSGDHDAAAVERAAFGR